MLFEGQDFQPMGVCNLYWRPGDPDGRWTVRDLSTGKEVRQWPIDALEGERLGHVEILHREDAR